MAVQVQDLVEWLNTFGPEDIVFVDDGGQTLRSIADPNVYFNVGGEHDDEGDAEVPITACDTPGCSLCRALGLTDDQPTTRA